MLSIPADVAALDLIEDALRRARLPYTDGRKCRLQQSVKRHVELRPLTCRVLSRAGGALAVRLENRVGEVMDVILSSDRCSLDRL
jgi:hypothetical protein